MGPDPILLASLEEKKTWTQTRTEGRWCDHTGNRQASTSQGDRPGVAPSLAWLSEGTSSADTVFLDFQPPELGHSKSVVEAPQLWYWVLEA